MSQQPPPNDDDQPVRNGLIALIGVSLAVGVVLAIVAVIGTHILGIGGSSDAQGAGQGESMYIPPPQKTTQSDGLLITLNTQDAASADATTESPSADPTSKSPDTGQISLQALETTVPSFGKIDLTGVYPGGEGEVLQVQRKQQGSPWADFPATVPVSDSTFSTYVQTGQVGKTSFRVIDKSRNVASNPVVVTIQ